MLPKIPKRFPGNRIHGSINFIHKNETDGKCRTEEEWEARNVITKERSTATNLERIFCKYPNPI